MALKYLPTSLLFTQATTLSSSRDSFTRIPFSISSTIAFSLLLLNRSILDTPTLRSSLENAPLIRQSRCFSLAYCFTAVVSCLLWRVVPAQWRHSKSTPRRCRVSLRCKQSCRIISFALSMLRSCSSITMNLAQSLKHPRSSVALRTASLLSIFSPNFQPHIDLLASELFLKDYTSILSLLLYAFMRLQTVPITFLLIFKIFPPLTSHTIPQKQSFMRQFLCTEAKSLSTPILILLRILHFTISVKMFHSAILFIFKRILSFTPTSHSFCHYLKTILLSEILA